MPLSVEPCHQGVVPAFAATGTAAAHLVEDGDARVG